MELIYLTRNELLHSGTVTQRWRQLSDSSTDKLKIYIVDPIANTKGFYDFARSLENPVFVIGKIYTPKLFDILIFAKQHSITTIADINDNYLDTPTDCETNISERSKFFREVYAFVDGLFVSTHEMASKLEYYNILTPKLVLKDPIQPLIINTRLLKKKLSNLKTNSITGVIFCTARGMGEYGGAKIVFHPDFQSEIQNISRLLICTNEKALDDNFLERCAELPCAYEIIDYCEWSMDQVLNWADVAFVIRNSDEFSIAKTENRVTRALSRCVPVIANKTNIKFPLVAQDIQSLKQKINITDNIIEEFSAQYSLYFDHLKPQKLCEKAYNFLIKLHANESLITFVDHKYCKTHPEIGVIAVSDKNKTETVFYRDGGMYPTKKVVNILANFFVELEDNFWTAQDLEEAIIKLRLKYQWMN